MMVFGDGHLSAYNNVKFQKLQKPQLSIIYIKINILNKIVLYRMKKWWRDTETFPQGAL